MDKGVTIECGNYEGQNTRRGKRKVIPVDMGIEIDEGR